MWRESHSLYPGIKFLLLVPAAKKGEDTKDGDEAPVRKVEEMRERERKKERLEKRAPRRRGRGIRTSREIEGSLLLLSLAPLQEIAGAPQKGFYYLVGTRRRHPHQLFGGGTKINDILN